MKPTFTTISWEQDKVRILDQTLLPNEVVYKYIETAPEMAEAIQSLRVRGAPLIGVSTAYGVALAAQKVNSRKQIEDAIDMFARTKRKTAYNLFAALKKMKNCMRAVPVENPAGRGELSLLRLRLLEEAHRMREEDEALCQRIGDNGSSLISEGACCMTQCNAGALATCGIGTALAPIYMAKEKVANVFVPETRPLLQGARLTAWELMQAGVPATLICDSMRGPVMKNTKIDLCIVGADRIAKNGDTANKIGTYTLAVLAKTHNIPFFVAAPSTTFDPTIESGDEIPIELRDADEVRKMGNTWTAPRDVDVFNPAFDVTPNEYITGFITENGIERPPFG
jgi:methylthioribose-1-phosphate isomerase